MPYKRRLVSRFGPESCPIWGNPTGEALTEVGNIRKRKQAVYVVKSVKAVESKSALSADYAD